MASDAIATKGLQVRRFNYLRIAVLTVGIAVVAVVAIASPGFLTSQNIKSALDSIAIAGIAAVGLTAITVSGNMVSLSTGALAGATAVTYALLLEAGLGVGFALALALGFALLIGILQGVVVAIGMNPIVTTLAVGGLLAGLAPTVSPSLQHLPAGAAVWLGQAQVFGVAMPVFLFALMTVVVTLLMRGTRPGRRLYLTGSNADSAHLAGLWPAAATCLAFTGASIAVGLAGIVGSEQVGIVTMTSLAPLTFTTITAVVLGGAALTGGSGSAVATAVAAIFVGLVENVVALHGLAYGVQLAIQGFFICVAVIGYTRLANRGAA